MGCIANTGACDDLTGAGILYGACIARIALLILTKVQLKLVVWQIKPNFKCSTKITKVRQIVLHLVHVIPLQPIQHVSSRLRTTILLEGRLWEPAWHFAPMQLMNATSMKLFAGLTVLEVTQTQQTPITRPTPLLALVQLIPVPVLQLPTPTLMLELLPILMLELQQRQLKVQAVILRHRFLH